MDITEKRSNRTLLMAAIAFALLFTTFHCALQFNGNDFWWHQKVGEWISNNGTVPRTDIFSWYGQANGFAWIAHEWLFEIIIYQIYHIAGDAGIVVTIGILQFLLCSLIAVIAGKNAYKNQVLYVVLMGLICFSISFASLARPQMFSYIFMLLEMWILYDFFEHPDHKRIFLVPVIAVLWSNVHSGTALLAYGLPFMFLVAGLFRFSFGKVEAQRLPKKALYSLLAVFVLSIGAIFVNPIGMDAFLYPFINQGNSFMIGVVSEWASPDAKVIGQIILYYIPVALYLLMFVVTEKKIRLIDIFAGGFFLFLFLRSIRFAPLMFIAFSFSAMRYLPEFMVHSGVNRTKFNRAMCHVITFFILTGSVVMTITGIVKSRGISEILSNEMIQTVKEQDDKRIYNDYNLGEALIAHDIPVFVDARADLYFENETLEKAGSLCFVCDYTKNKDYSENGAFDIEKLISEFDFDGLLTQNGTPLNAYLSSHPECYTVVFSDWSGTYYTVSDERG